MRKIKALLASMALVAAPAIAAPNFDAPIVSSTVVTVGTSYPSGKSIAAVCTAAGSITYVLANGGAITIPAVVGYQSYPFAVTQISASTGTCTIYELY